MTTSRNTLNPCSNTIVYNAGALQMYWLDLSQCSSTQCPSRQLTHSPDTHPRYLVHLGTSLQNQVYCYLTSKWTSLLRPSQFHQSSRYNNSTNKVSTNLTKTKMPNKAIHIIRCTFTIAHNRWYYIFLVDNSAHSDIEHLEQLSFYTKIYWIHYRIFASSFQSAEKLECTF